VSSVKAKTDSNAVRFFSANSLGSSLRVFLTVPNSVSQVLSEQELGQCVRREEIVSGNVTAGTVNRSCQITFTTLALCCCSPTHLPFQFMLEGCTGSWKWLDVEAIPVWLGWNVDPEWTSATKAHQCLIDADERWWCVQCLALFSKHRNCRWNISFSSYGTQDKIIF